MSTLDTLVDQELDQYAETVGPEWKKLAVFLGISWSRIFQLQKDNDYNQLQTVSSILKEWHAKSFHNETDVIKKVAEIHRSLFDNLNHIWEGSDINDDKFLYILGEDIGADRWKTLAAQIQPKFSKGQIANFVHNNKHCVSDAIMDMLVFWKNKYRDKSHCLPKLFSALVRSDCIDIASKVARNIKQTLVLS